MIDWAGAATYVRPEIFLGFFRNVSKMRTGPGVREPIVPHLNIPRRTHAIGGLIRPGRAVRGAAAVLIAGGLAAAPLAAAQTASAAPSPAASVTGAASAAAPAAGVPAAGVAAALPPPASALQEVTGFGPNPTSLRMF